MNTMKPLLPACAKCGIDPSQRACRTLDGKGPAFCPTNTRREAIDRAKKSYTTSHIREFARQASIQEAACYANRDSRPYVTQPTKPRLEEIMDFAHRMGYSRLGVAFCAGLQREAALLTRVLEHRGFEVVSVICKVGCVPKQAIGVENHEQIRPGGHESMCNPVSQAEVLNEAETHFNILLGLCVGHDSLFFMHAQAPTTVFAAKDRVLGHNPLAALYTLGSYYRRFDRA